MTFFRFLSVVLFFFIYISTSVHAQADPEKVKSIIRKALTFDVTEEVHSEYWHYFGDLDNLSENKKAEIQYIEESLILSQNWQLAFWDSALATLQNQRITKSPEYYKYYKILSKESAYDKSLESAENILKSILKKEYIELPTSFLELLGSQERGIILNEDAITLIRDNLGVNFDRLEVLTSPIWPPKSKENIYVKQRLKYMSPIRLAFVNIDLGMASVDAWNSWRAISKDLSLEIVVADFQKNLSQQLLHEDYLNLASNMGINYETQEGGYWHGLSYSLATAKYDAAGTELYSAFQTIVDGKNSITYTVNITSANNMLEALSVLERTMFQLSPL